MNAHTVSLETLQKLGERAGIRSVKGDLNLANSHGATVDERSDITAAHEPSPTLRGTCRRAVRVVSPVTAGCAAAREATVSTDRAWGRPDP